MRTAVRAGAASAVAALVVALVGGCSVAPPRSAVVAAAPAVPAVATRAAHPAEPAKAAAPVSLAPSWLSIPSIGVRDLQVVAYVGRPDDPAGTEIEDGGLAASPRGAAGGVGPGVVGNFIVTGHRTSAGGPLRRLPQLRVGAHVLVRSGSSLYDFVVTGTLSVSFRSQSSQALQTAAVPGHPGRAATRAMITLSTCATLEDHAAGNYWRDGLGNPEHRIDRIGVLVAVRPA